MGLHIRHSLCKCSPSITKDIKYNDKNNLKCSTSCLLNHRCSFQISRAYYITAGKRRFLDVTVKGNEHRFKNLYKWESVNTSISNYLKKNIFWKFSDKTITLKKLKYCTFLIWFTFYAWLAYDKIMCFIDLWPVLCDVIGRHLEKG
jgi:hypothetical protein